MLLKPGSILRNEEGEILDARSSVVLIVSGSAKLVVDTGLAGEEKAILENLAMRGLDPVEVDLVVNTHNHPDHCGNNHLFSRAEMLSPENTEDGEAIASGVWILGTPGHTQESISIVCESDRVVVMAGDALPTRSNYLKWVPPRLHVDGELAMKSMTMIVDLADVVVPGHDKPFSVRDGGYSSYLD
ncbi:MAG: MBL fold metallo-hydrolase [Euryarchaeota archaeon]|nr:MBL fold metallo-hydrolase [Euryarchaeota archaeon]